MSRRGAVYALMFINFCLLLGLGYAIKQTQNLNSHDDSAQLALNTGCKRGNATRSVQVFILQQLESIASVVSQSATSPEIAEKFKTDLPKYSKKLKSLHVKPEAHPQENDPFLVDCDEAWPLNGR